MYHEQGRESRSLWERLSTAKEVLMPTVGIDVGKYKHVACALDEEGKVLGKALRFNNSQAGFERLLAYLAALTETTIGIEATGHY